MSAQVWSQGLPQIPLTPAGRVERDASWLKGVEEEAACLEVADLMDRAELYEELATLNATVATSERGRCQQALLQIAGRHAIRAGIYKATAIAKRVA